MRRTATSAAPGQRVRWRPLRSPVRAGWTAWRARPNARNGTADSPAGTPCPVFPEGSPTLRPSTIRSRRRWRPKGQTLEMPRPRASRAGVGARSRATNRGSVTCELSARSVTRRWAYSSGARRAQTGGATRSVVPGRAWDERLRPSHPGALRCTCRPHECITALGADQP